MAQEENYRVNAYIVSTGYDLVDKWFTYYDDAEIYFDDQVAVFQGDHGGRDIFLQLIDGSHTYRTYEFPEESMEDD